MKRTTTRWLATIGVALAVTACGGPPGNQHNAGSDKLTIGEEAIPTSLDPGQCCTRPAAATMELTGGTLTTKDPDGKNFGMGLAASVEPVGQKRWVVTLKPNLEFSDGSALTARDVVASFDHYLHDATNAVSFNFDSIKNVTSAGDLTVNFDLKQPFPVLPYFLAWPQTAILPAKSIEAKGTGLYQGEPNPTAGQFQVESFDKNQITLKANPHYIGHQPSVKTIVIKKIIDPATRLAQLQGGELDVAAPLAPKQVAQLSDPVEVHTATAVNGLTAVGMNNRDNSVISDVRIRKAIAMALNRDQINQVAYVSLNQPVLSLWATASRYNDPISYLSKGPDVERARKMLTGTKCANGCTLRLIVASESQEGVDSAVVVQQNLKAIGIKVNIAKYDSASVTQDALEGNYDLMYNSVFFNDDTPDYNLRWLFGPAVKAWRTGYSSPDMNRLTQEVFTSSGPARDAAVDRVNALFKKDLPFAPVSDYVVVWASRVPSATFDITSTFSYRVG